MEATGAAANNKAGLKCEIDGQSCEFNVTGGAWQNAVYHITFTDFKPSSQQLQADALAA